MSPKIPNCDITFDCDKNIKTFHFKETPSTDNKRKASYVRISFLCWNVSFLKVCFKFNLSIKKGRVFQDENAQFPCIFGLKFSRRSKIRAIGGPFFAKDEDLIRRS